MANDDKVVYVIEVYKGAWDDWTWWVHGIYDDPFKADEAKRLLLANIEEDKQSEDFSTSYHAKKINDVKVIEYKLNKVHNRGDSH